MMNVVMLKNSAHLQTGQAGIIVLLTMVGMLTVGLSLASRTTQEALLAGKEKETVRVFNAAEQGIESALSSDLDFEGDSLAGTISSIEGLEVDYNIQKENSMDTRLFEGVAVTIDVTGAADGNILRVDWSRESDCASENLASLIASIYYDDAGTTRVRHLTLGACERGDGFTLRTTIDDNGLHRRAGLTLTSNDFMVRIKPVYNDTHVNIYSSSFTLPVQYYVIRSTATNPDTNETRIVEVDRTLATAPSIFDFTVFDGSSALSK